MSEFKIDPDYNEVAQRLADLFAKHPEASMRGSYEFVTIGGQTGVVYTAECFRSPDDPMPGVGTAWEDVPGKTPYTRGSEVQNAETSAWGRAIVAVGASTSKKIASADDMRSARARQEAPPEPQHRPASKERIEKCKALILERDLIEWAQQQNYRWPWSDEACAYIELYAQNQPGPDASLIAGQPDANGEQVMTRAESKAKEAAAATVPAVEEVAQTVATTEGLQSPEEIAAEVAQMSSAAVFAELEAAGLSSQGAPKALKDRLTAHRALAAAVAVDQSDEPF